MATVLPPPQTPVDKPPKGPVLNYLKNAEYTVYALFQMKAYVFKKSAVSRTAAIYCACSKSMLVETLNSLSFDLLHMQCRRARTSVKKIGAVNRCSSKGAFRGNLNCAIVTAHVQLLLEPMVCCAAGPPVLPLQS